MAPLARTCKFHKYEYEGVPSTSFSTSNHRAICWHVSMLICGYVGMMIPWYVDVLVCFKREISRTKFSCLVRAGWIDFKAGFLPKGGNDAPPPTHSLSLSLPPSPPSLPPSPSLSPSVSLSSPLIPAIFGYTHTPPSPRPPSRYPCSKACQ